MDKKKDNIQTIGEAIRGLLSTYHLEAKFDEMKLVESWGRIVGKPIARRTRRVFVKNRILYVELESPSIKHDFSLHKTQVLELFKKEFGPSSIEEIVII